MKGRSPSQKWAVMELKRLLRDYPALTQCDMAAGLCCTRVVVCYWLNGQRNPDPLRCRMIYAFCKRYRILGKWKKFQVEIAKRAKTLQRKQKADPPWYRANLHRLSPLAYEIDPRYASAYRAWKATRTRETLELIAQSAMDEEDLVVTAAKVPQLRKE